MSRTQRSNCPPLPARVLVLRLATVLISFLVAVVAVFGVTVTGAFVPALAAWSLVLVVLGALVLYETVELKRIASVAM